MIIVYDIETCNFNPDTDVLEVGYVKLHKLGDKNLLLGMGMLNFWSNSWTIDYGSQNATGLTPELMKEITFDGDTRVFSAGISKVMSVFHKNIWYGFNNKSFDDSRIKRFISDYNVDCLQPQCMQSIDFREEYKGLFEKPDGSRKTGTLSDWCQQLGVTTKDILTTIVDNQRMWETPINEKRLQFHGALYDAVATALCKARAEEKFGR